MSRLPNDPPPPSPSPALPPAGDARREELKRRDDSLAEQVEAASAEGGSVDPAALEIDNELAFEIVERNTLAVSKARDDMLYAWVRAFDAAGRPVLGPVAEKQTIRIRTRNGDVVPVWEVVAGTGTHMPEALESKDANGWRRLGDCILMRAKRDVLAALDKHERDSALTFARQHEANVEEMAAQTGAFRFHNTGGMHPRDWARARAAYAKQGATQVFDRMLRDGTVPNMPPAAVAR